MRQRCNYPKSASYPRYGGRGIRVCSQWSSFSNFASDIEGTIGDKPEGHTLDRIDNDGNYEPGNVRWATRSQQTFNSRQRNDNTSGKRGVSWSPLHKKWRARVQLNGKRHEAGMYDSVERAEAGYWAKRKELGL